MAEPDEILTAEGYQPRVVSEGFHQRVYAIVAQVPAGKVSTYGDIAALLGSRRVARHVGFALAALDDEDIPWHRIVNARGNLSGLDERRKQRQSARLRREGVEVDGERVAIKRFRWERGARA